MRAHGAVYCGKQSARHLEAGRQVRSPPGTPQPSPPPSTVNRFGEQSVRVLHEPPNVLASLKRTSPSPRAALFLSSGRSLK